MPGAFQGNAFQSTPAPVSGQTVEGSVYTALKNLANGRCYALIFPQPEPEDGRPMWPAIRYNIISRVNPVDICGTDFKQTDDTRVQIDVVALSYGAVLALEDQVIAAMMDITDPPAVRDGTAFETFDEETRTYRGVLDYLFCGSSVGVGSP